MTQAIQNEIDAYKHRQSKLTSLTSNMTSESAQRLREIRHRYEVELALRFGNRLDPMIVKRLVEGVVAVPEVIGAVFAGIDDTPKTQAEWAEFCDTQVQADELATRSVEFNDEKTKLRIHEIEIAALNPNVRMAMARSGELDSYLDDKVAERLDRNV